MRNRPTYGLRSTLSSELSVVKAQSEPRCIRDRHAIINNRRECDGVGEFTAAKYHLFRLSMRDEATIIGGISIGRNRKLYRGRAETASVMVSLTSSLLRRSNKVYLNPLQLMRINTDCRTFLSHQRFPRDTINV